jgi:membrane protease YdiL (CAAX protease family)
MLFVRKIINLAIVFLIAETAPFVAAYFTNIFNPTILKIDPQGYFLWMAVHHLLQFTVGILILKVYFKRSFKELGFNLGNIQLSLKIFKWFAIIWPFIIIAFFIIFSISVKGFPGYISELYPLEVRNVISTFAFDLLMLSAIGEEPIFRSFTGLALSKYWDKKIRLLKFEFSHAAIISAFIFMVSHINYDIIPFRIINIDPVKLFLNLFFGLFLAVVFEKTKSLLCAALAHSYSNIIIYACGFLTAYLVQ